MAKAGALASAFVFSLSLSAAPKKVSKSPTAKQTPAPERADGKSDTQLETYQDLILKAQNLTLQQDRLQASQVLIRGLQREAKDSVAYRELARSLEDLTSVFYTEKAQNAFAGGEAVQDQKPREAVDRFLEALKTEDRNVAILKALARAYLRLEECEKAEPIVKQSEEVNPYSSEVRLLRLQVLDCQKNYDGLAVRLAAIGTELEAIEPFLKGLQIGGLVRKKDFKKARAFLSSWESSAPDYPEVYYWKWELTRQTGSADRASAVKYSQLCQNLSPRKRKSFSLDVDLCKGKEVVEVYLRETETQPTSPSPPKAEEAKP